MDGGEHGRQVRHGLGDRDAGVAREISKKFEECVTGTLSSLADLAGVIPAHLSRVFRRKTGMSVTDYLTMRRIVKAKKLLSASDDKIVWIAEQCGFINQFHFSRKFKQFSGRSPSGWRGDRWQRRQIVPRS